MTELGFPALSEPVLEQGVGARVFGGTWARYLRNQWMFMGHSKDVTVFDTVSASVATDFAAGADNSTDVALVLPNSYKAGTAVRLFVQWHTNDTNTGNVKWDIGHQTAATGETLPAATTTTSLSAATGTSLSVIEVQVVTIAGTGLIRGTVVKVNAARNGAHANDTYGGTATLLSVGVKCQLEGIGTVKAYP